MKANLEENEAKFPPAQMNKREMKDKLRALFTKNVTKYEGALKRSRPNNEKTNL